jgi:hypothetical protein
MLEPCENRYGVTRRALALSVAALAILAVQQPSVAAPEPVKLAVFDFELDDKSAGAGIIAPDAIDAEMLKQSTEEARRMLAGSGRYSIIDTSGAAGDVTAAGGIRHCNGCDGPIASKLGAELSMIGIVTRVNRTEFTLQILIRDASTGAVKSNDFTGLRMGANYAWSRGVKWLMDNKILAAQQAK